jgi:hypothetical protein
MNSFKPLDGGFAIHAGHHNLAMTRLHALVHHKKIAIKDTGLDQRISMHLDNKTAVRMWDEFKEGQIIFDITRRL